MFRKIGTWKEKQSYLEATFFVAFEAQTKWTSLFILNSKASIKLLDLT